MGKATLLSFCVRVCVCECECVCVCVNTKLVFISKFKETTNLKLGLRQKVALYKTGNFLQASVAQTVCKLEN